MAELSTLDAVQALHRDLVAIREGRSDGSDFKENDLVVVIFGREFERLWDRPPKSDASRSAVKSGSLFLNLCPGDVVDTNSRAGKVTIDGEEYSINAEFQQAVLYLSDEADIDEIEAARYMLESEEDRTVLARQLLECGIIRYHQQRNYVLDCVRLFLEIASLDEERDLSDDQLENIGVIAIYVAATLFRTPPKGLVSRCMAGMQYAKSWLQKVADRITAASVIVDNSSGNMSEEMETIEFSRTSLVQQHELIGVILSRAIEQGQGSPEEFKSFLQLLKKADKYDQLLGR